MWYLIAFIGGMLVGLATRKPLDALKLRYKRCEGYKAAVDDMITFCYWRENGGSGARHTGVWFPDD